MNRLKQTRRDFLRMAVAAGSAVSLASCGLTTRMAPRRPLSPSDRLNIGVIGPRGRGAANAKAVAHENIIALCDIDEKRLADAAAEHPGAQQFKDFRHLLDLEELDAVVVATPDHMHAIPAVRAMQAGLDVYCEKPLAHSVHEVRAMREAAKKHGCVTQMGTQIHANDNYRRCVEIVQSGMLGPIRRVFVWKSYSPVVLHRAKTDSKPPAHVDYDLWLGPAPYRPFSEESFHFKWRYWWDFGNGQLGDFGCHYMDLPHWALELREPVTIEARGNVVHDGDNCVPDNLEVEYHHAARGELPPVHLTWYHGTKRPEEAQGLTELDSAVLFEGDKGRLLANYGTRQIFMADGDGEPVAPPETIAPSVGHHQEWIDAIKTRGTTRNTTSCNFDYSGALAETVLLGNVSYRCGKRLEWDSDALRATNAPEAAQYVQREYRAGWSL
jgi:predicted dehydrogenase